MCESGDDGVEPAGDERVRVAIRVRPPNQREQLLRHQHHEHVTKCVQVDDTVGQISILKRRNERDPDRESRFQYDRVFPSSATQEDVFGYVCESVQQVAQGFNCTIFAYGQTGTGKTHTMLGKDLERDFETLLSVSAELEADAAMKETWGVIPRAIASLFDEIRSISRHGAAAIVHCSYMQIYNNDVYDLLQENKQRMKDPLVIREMIKGNDKHIYASGLSEFRITSLEEALKLLKLGNKNRTIRATEYNERSSRSHALLQLAVEVETRGVEGPTTIIRRAKLNLVDLAGSEKWDTDVSMGTDRCKELTSINQSLSALGNVISALANPKRTHIPYRDSKLTRLLQDSLGGNCRTVVIATISPDESALEETLSTLMFADRAKCVIVRVRANELVDDAILLAQAQREITRLKIMLKKNASHEKVTALEHQVSKLTRENSLLSMENKRLKQTVSMLRRGSDTVAAVRPITTNGEDHTPHRLVPTSPRVSIPPLAASRTVTTPRVTLTTPPLGLEELRRDIGQGIAKDSLFGRGPSEQIRLEISERDQTRALEEIVTERRELEKELERMEMQTRHTASDSQPEGSDDDELCPMCGRIIDSHTDGELDECIEAETRALKTVGLDPASNQDSKSTTTTRGLEPRKPKTETPPVRRSTVLTPRSGAQRRGSTPISNTSSPYAQDLFRKPHAPSTSLERTAPVIEASKDGRLRPSSAGQSTSDNNRQLSEDHAPPLDAPILRQGSKSVKALKKFQAASPYNVTRRREQPVAESRRTQPLPRNQEADERGDDQVSNSIRDIGLKLLVYKFRYDCWYPCTVVGFDSKRRLHCCVYENGDKQWQEIAERRVQIVGRSGNDSE